MPFIRQEMVEKGPYPTKNGLKGALIRRKMVEKSPYPTKNGLKGALIRRKMAERGLNALFIYRFRRNCQFSPNVGAT